MQAKYKRGLIIGSLVLVIIFGILFAQFSVALSRTLNQVYYIESEESNNLREIDYTKDFSFAVYGVDDKRAAEGLYFIDSVQIFQVDFDQDEIFSLTVDPELTVDFLDNVNDFQTIRNSFQLRQLYNYWRNEGFSEEDAIRLFSNQLEKTIGLRIDRYIWLELSALEKILDLYKLRGGADVQLNDITQPQSNLDDQLTELNNKYINYWRGLYNPITLGAISFYANVENKLLGENIKTNFSQRELITFLSRGRSWTRYQIQTAITGNEFQFINFEFKYLDTSEFDEEYRPLLVDNQIKLEQARIDLINGSGVNRLAANSRRLLINEGFNIVRTDNSETNYDSAQLYLANPFVLEEFPLTIERLQLIYPDLEITSEEFPGRATGDLILVVVK